jgi:hypothetical protein
MPHQLPSVVARTTPPKPKQRQRQIETALPPNRHVETTPQSDRSDWIWHGEAIAKEIGCTPEQLYYLFSQGVFGDAVFKLGRKTMVASRSRLRELPTLLSRKTL